MRILKKNDIFASFTFESLKTIVNIVKESTENLTVSEEDISINIIKVSYTNEKNEDSVLFVEYFSEIDEETKLLEHYINTIFIPENSDDFDDLLDTITNYKKLEEESNNEKNK